jgi:TPP-dependent pyruvate/acetoin dehydrogenase alpha subunit
MQMNKDDLIAFEEQVAKEFESAAIFGPVHLSGGNEDELINIFEKIKPSDWVFSAWRNHYHALLHGIPKDYVLSEIRDGRSMNFNSPEHRFFSSAIVGGIAPIAVGVAAALKRDNQTNHVWCFVGDMAATLGIYHESQKYAIRNDLPITFVIEDNGVSCNSPTSLCWGEDVSKEIRSIRYSYERKYPHVGVGRFVQF